MEGALGRVKKKKGGKKKEKGEGRRKKEDKTKETVTQMTIDHLSWLFIVFFHGTLSTNTKVLWLKLPHLFL